MLDHFQIVKGPALADQDGDGVDDPFDNCLVDREPGSGRHATRTATANSATSDFNNDGSVVKNGDFALALSQVGNLTCGPTGAAPCPGPPYNCCVCDFNQDGICKSGEAAAVGGQVR